VTQALRTPADVRGRRRALVTLSVTQTTGWGVLYYALPVALPSITADTGWSATAVTAAFSAGLVTSALVGIPVGRWLDRHGPRRVMTTGSVLGSLAGVGIATAPDYPTFALSWLVAGAAMAAVLYQAAFAALTRWYGADRVRTITRLTLVAGLASTVFAPLTHLLVEQLGWRGAYLVLTAVLAAVTVPLHGLALTAPWHRGDEPSPGRSATRSRVPPEVRTTPFLVLALALSVGSLGTYAASLTLIPTLMAKGISPGLAAVALGLIGAGQLAGRLAYAPLAARTTAAGRTTAVLVAGAVAIVLLAALPGPGPLLLAVAVALGAVRGAATLLQATAVTDRWGVGCYATLSGWLGAPVTTAAAVAPWAATGAAEAVGSYPPVLSALALLMLVAALTGPRSGRPFRSSLLVPDQPKRPEM
jgi:MFS family permease